MAHDDFNDKGPSLHSLALLPEDHLEIARRMARASTCLQAILKKVTDKQMPSIGKTYNWPGGYEGDPVITNYKNRTIVRLTRMIEAQAYRIRIDAGIWAN